MVWCSFFRFEMFPSNLPDVNVVIGYVLPKDQSDIKVKSLSSIMNNILTPEIFREYLDKYESICANDLREGIMTLKDGKGQRAFTDWVALPDCIYPERELLPQLYDLKRR